MRASNLIPALQGELEWWTCQVGRSPNQTMVDRSENLWVTCLQVLSHDPRRYRAWFDRVGFVNAFRRGASTAFSKSWSRMFRRLGELVLSDLAVLERELPAMPLATPEPKTLSPARLAALEKARPAGRRQRNGGPQRGRLGLPPFCATVENTPKTPRVLRVGTAKSGRGPIGESRGGPWLSRPSNATVASFTRPAGSSI